MRARSALAAAVLIAAAACDCGGRDVDAHRYACAGVLGDDCGPGWTCVHEVCVEDSAAGGGGGAGGGSAQGGGGASSDGGEPCDLRTAPQCPGGRACLLPESPASTAGTCGGPCDPVAQDCANGLRCSLYYLGTGTDYAFGCVHVGALGEDAPCGFLGPTGDDCGTGLVCIGVAGNTICTRFCDLAAHGCSPGKDCASTLASTQGDALVCVVTVCNLFAQGCGQGLGCYPDMLGNTTCATTGTAAEGAPCSTVFDCVPGAACVNVGGVAACHRLCDLAGGAPACTSPQTCHLAGDETGFPLPNGAGVCQ